MTVEELIEELKKMPQHHPVMLVSYQDDMETGGVFDVWSFIDKVESTSNNGDIGPIVKICAEVNL